MCGDKDHVGSVTKITFEIAIFGKSLEARRVKAGDKDHVDNSLKSQGAVDNFFCPRNQTKKASWESSRWGSCENFYVVGSVWSVGSGGSRGSGDLGDVRDLGGLGLSLR